MRTALWFGAGFIASAVAGFLPGLGREGYLFGVFPVTTMSHLLHLLTGATALVAGFTSLHAARVYLRWLGSVYGGLALLVFVFGQPGPILDSSPVGFIYAGIAGTALYHGLGERLLELARDWVSILSRHGDRTVRFARERLESHARKEEYSYAQRRQIQIH